MVERKYKITEIVTEPTRFVVFADFIENEETISTIRHGFDLKLPPEEIEAAIKKSCETYFHELDASVIEKERMIEEAKYEETKLNLINKESTI